MNAATMHDALGGRLPSGEMTALGRARIAIDAGDPQAITPAEWVRRFRAMADRLNVPPAEGAVTCYRCDGAGWISMGAADADGARICEVCRGTQTTAPTRSQTCVVCHGTSVVHSGATSLGDPMFGKAVDCPYCAGSIRRFPGVVTRDLAMRQADVPDGYRSFTLDTYLDRDLSRSQIEAATMLCAFSSEPDTWRAHHGGRRALVLSGGVGVGKTGLAVAAMGASIDWAPAPKFVSWLALQSRISATYGDRTLGSRHKIIEELSRAWLLVLDDFGTAGRQASDHAATIAEELIEARSTGGNWTILTTNLDRAGIEAEFGARVASRLDGMAVWYGVEGQDGRREAAA